MFLFSLSDVWLFVTPWLQHSSLTCPSLSPGDCLDSCPLSWWCYLTISSSTTLFSFCLQSFPFPASGSFPASASASVLPVNIQGWFPLGITGWISLLSKGLSSIFSRTTVQKHQFFGVQPFLCYNSHIHTWLLEKIIALTRWTFVSIVNGL